MRRIATAAALLAALGGLGGCRSMRTPWDSVRRPPRVGAPEGEAVPRDEAVPNSVMLRDHARAGYGDSPSGP